MNPTTKKIVIGLVLVVLGIGIGLGVAYGMKRAQDFDRMMDAREAAPDKAEFDRNFEAMTQWFEDYKAEHPGATDEDAKRAFDELWKG